MVAKDRAASGSGSAGLLVTLVVAVVLEGFFQLVFEDDDPAGGLLGGAVVDHLPGSCGQA